MPPRPSAYISPVFNEEENDKITCPIPVMVWGRHGRRSDCGKNFEGRWRYLAMMDHIRMVHPEHYIPNKPANEESIRLMVSGGDERGEQIRGPMEGPLAARGGLPGHKNTPATAGSAMAHCSSNLSLEENCKIPEVLRPSHHGESSYSTVSTQPSWPGHLAYSSSYPLNLLVQQNFPGQQNLAVNLPVQQLSPSLSQNPAPAQQSLPVQQLPLSLSQNPAPAQQNLPVQQLPLSLYQNPAPAQQNLPVPDPSAFPTHLISASSLIPGTYKLTNMKMTLQDKKLLGVTADITPLDPDIEVPYAHLVLKDPKILSEMQSDKLKDSDVFTLEPFSDSQSRPTASNSRTGIIGSARHTFRHWLDLVQDPKETGVKAVLKSQHVSCVAKLLGREEQGVRKEIKSWWAMVAAGGKELKEDFPYSERRLTAGARQWLLQVGRS